MQHQKCQIATPSSIEIGRFITVTNIVNCTEKWLIFTSKHHFTVKKQGKSPIFTVYGVFSPSLSPSRSHPRVYRDSGFPAWVNLPFLVSYIHRYFMWWVFDSDWVSHLGKKSRNQSYLQALSEVMLRHILWATWWRYRLRISSVTSSLLSWYRVGRRSRMAWWKSWCFA